MPGQMISRTDAEVLIDEQVSREIIEGTIKQSRAMSMFRRLPNMTSNKTKMRVLDSLPLVYWQNGDNAKKKITKMAWDKKYIVAEEMAVIVPIPEAVLDDASYDIWADVRPRIEEAMGKKFDQAVFTGADKPAGFRADLLTSVLNAGATITPGSDTLYKSINDAMVKVEESGYNVTGVVGGVDVKGKFRMMTDTTGQPIKGTEIDSLSKAYVDNGAWDKTLAQMIVGDFTQAVYAIRQDITFKVLDQAVIQDPSTGEIVYNLAQDDMVALRVVMRLGWEIPNPINALQPDESVRFPFAAILPGSYTEDRVDVTINVKDQDATNLSGAKVNFNGQIKTTNASGNAVFKANKNSTGLYRVTAEDMKRDAIGSVEVAAAAKTENVVINVKKKVGIDPEITGLTITPTSGLQEGNANVNADAVVATLSAAGGTSPFSYNLEADETNGVDNASFKIDGTNVKVNTTPLTAKEYKINVKVTDSKSKTFTNHATISVAAAE